MSPWLKNPWIITYGAKLEFLCMYVFVILLSSFRPSWVHLSRDGHQDILHHQLSVSTDKQLQFLSQTLSCLHCFLSLERPKWDMYTGTLGRREGKLAGWLETSVLGEHSQPFDRKNDWQWVFARLADMGTQRLVSWEGQDGKRCARMRTTSKITQTVSPANYDGGKRFLRWFKLFFKKQSEMAHMEMQTKEHLLTDALKFFIVLDI